MTKQPQKRTESPVLADSAASGDDVPAGPSREEIVYPAASVPFVIASETLLGGRSEVHIRHRGEIYRLTLTRAGKLILHK